MSQDDENEYGNQVVRIGAHSHRTPVSRKDSAIGNGQLAEDARSRGCASKEHAAMSGGGLQAMKSSWFRETVRRISKRFSNRCKAKPKLLSGVFLKKCHLVRCRKSHRNWRTAGDKGFMSVSGDKHGREVTARAGRVPGPVREIPVERETDAFCVEASGVSTPSASALQATPRWGPGEFGEDGHGPVESIFP